jgi:hypothetical protein
MGDDMVQRIVCNAKLELARIREKERLALFVANKNTDAVEVAKAAAAAAHAAAAKATKALDRTTLDDRLAIFSRGIGSLKRRAAKARHVS